MENGNISNSHANSVNTQNQPSQQGSINLILINGYSSESEVFVNHADIAWHERRRQWVGDQSRRLQRTPREPIMSWTTSYEDLLCSTELFHQPIPLAEMVDFLVDIWQEEGLYD